MKALEKTIAALRFLTAEWDGNVKGRTLYTETVSFGVKDAKKRDVGGYVEIMVYDSPHSVHVATRSTRDTKTFGAIPRRTSCATIDDAKRIGLEKLLTAAKRQRKQFPPDHSRACMTTYLLSGDPECPACGDEAVGS